MKIVLDHDDLTPLVERVISETLAKIGTSAERIAYSEREAAEMLGMAPHQLRDRRLEGAIQAKRIGKSYYYSPEVLRRFVK